MRHLFACAALLATACAAVPAFAQDAEDSWTGVYAGVRAGYAFQPADNGETVLFDTNLDGTFGDQVRTGAGADAFSTGFCGGGALGPQAATGCGDDKDSYDVAAHVGFDYQLGAIVVGVVGEYGRMGIRDDVAAFSTTPASYTLSRKLQNNGSIRARIGFALGNTLAYATGGYAVGKIATRFRSTNVANAFTNSGNDNVNGYRYGGGLEHRIGRNFSIGAVYLYTTLKDDDFTVRTARGSAPATNPFVLVNPAGTDFRRSSDRFNTHSVSVTTSFRF